MDGGTIAIIMTIIASVGIAVLVKIAKKSNKDKYKRDKQSKKPNDIENDYGCIAQNAPKKVNVNVETYSKKKRYVSKCEQEYYAVLKNIIQNEYLIYPQVPLSQIVEKVSDNHYHNELFRIIDFCIFSKTFEPLICIEINDDTHHQPERYKRDKKVKEILEEAKIPLITLWTEYGINEDYIEKRLREHLQIFTEPKAVNM